MRTWRLHRGDPQWCMKGEMGRRPHVWMTEIDGVICDIRRMPWHVQEEAFRLGRIPFVPREALVCEGAGEAE